MTRFSFVWVLLLCGICMSWAQAEPVVSETETTAIEEPATETAVAPVAEPVAESVATSETKKVFIPGAFDIQEKDNDMRILREKGENQRSKGSVMLVCGVALIPIGLVLVALNFQDYMDYYTSNDIEGRESAVIAFTAGDVALTAGVILAIVGVVVKNSGDKKIERADEYEKSKTAMNVSVLPIADVANKRGGLMLSANF